MKELDRRTILKYASGAAAIAAVTVGSTASGPSRVFPYERPRESAFTPSARPLRRYFAPFTGDKPQLLVLRDRPMDEAGQRWWSGVSGQSAAIHMEAKIDSTAIDGPSLSLALSRALDGGNYDVLLIEADGLGTTVDVASSLARAAEAGIPVIARASGPVDVPLLLRLDDAGMMANALQAYSHLPHASSVGLIAPLPGYSSIDRRMESWRVACQAAGWQQVLLSDGARSSVAPIDDGGVTARIIAQALAQQPQVVLLGAPSEFLLVSAAQAVAGLGMNHSVGLAGVLDFADLDLDLSSLWSSDSFTVSASWVDPAQMGAVCVRAAAHLMTGLIPPGSIVLIQGSPVSVPVLRDLAINTMRQAVGDGVVQHLSSPNTQLTTDWLPAVTL